jgi:hypothetical protein
MLLPLREMYHIERQQPSEKTLTSVKTDKIPGKVFMRPERAVHN